MHILLRFDIFFFQNNVNLGSESFIEYWMKSTFFIVKFCRVTPHCTFQAQEFNISLWIAIVRPVFIPVAWLFPVPCPCRIPFPWKYYFVCWGYSAKVQDSRQRVGRGNCNLDVAIFKVTMMSCWWRRRTIVSPCERGVWPAIFYYCFFRDMPIRGLVDRWASSLGRRSDDPLPWADAFMASAFDHWFYRLLVRFGLRIFSELTCLWVCALGHCSMLGWLPFGQDTDSVSYSLFP